MLWIGLHFDRLALDVFARAKVEHDTPLAVCDARAVLVPCPAAERAGVQPGMQRATALALSPALRILMRDPAREEELLAQLAACALQLTPSVSLEPPDGLLLEVAASLRLFGGLRPLAARLHAVLVPLGCAMRLAAADNPRAASLSCRAPDAARDPMHDPAFDASDAAALQALCRPRLEALPPTLLRAAQPHLEVIHGLGVRTLGELDRLPRDGLAKRFGPALPEEIDRACGRRPEPRAWFAAPATFAARLELPAQVESTEALLFGAHRLLAQLSGWLGARQAATRQFTILAEHDDAPPTLVELRLADPSRDLDRFMVLLRERLAQVTLPAPAHTLRLACDRAMPLAHADGRLFDADPQAREGLGRLVERLQARLGRDRVGRLNALPDHRPERAWRIVPVDALPGAPSHAQAPASASRRGLPRPLWLLRRPLPLAERMHRPWLHGPLELVAGPERIEGGWWDMHLVQRDYFIAQDEASALYWVFRARGTDGASPAWFLHGCFG